MIQNTQVAQNNEPKSKKQGQENILANQKYLDQNKLFDQTQILQQKTLQYVPLISRCIESNTSRPYEWNSLYLSQEKGTSTEKRFLLFNLKDFPQSPSERTTLRTECHMKWAAIT